MATGTDIAQCAFVADRRLRRCIQCRTGGGAHRGATPSRRAAACLDPNERLFVTISAGDATLPLMDRVQTIYPRYLVPQPVAGFPGLTYRGFRDDSPYQGEDLVFESNAPEHFLARCSRKGVTNTGICLLERRIGEADITFRFPRDWLPDWENVAKGIDRLVARLHPN
jgi:hypothetical protein